MTGSAVVTTRLSSVTMNSPSDVMTKVQSVCALVTSVPPSLFCECSLPYLPKKRGGSCGQHVFRRGQQPVGPRLRPLEQLHRHEYGDQRPAREELRDGLRRLTRRLLRELDEIAPRAAREPADVRVVARRPAAEHEHQAVAILHQLAVRL